MLRAEWLKRSSSAGHGSCLPVFGSRPNRKELISTARIPATYTARRPAPVLELICRDMRQQFTCINECRVTARLLTDNANLFQTIDQILHLVRYDKPASPRFMPSYRPTARRSHSAAFEPPYVGKPSCTTQRVLHSVYTSKKLSSFMHSRPPIGTIASFLADIASISACCRFRR